jgi:DNA polymerase-4
MISTNLSTSGISAASSCVAVEAVCSIDEIASRQTGSQQNVNTAGALADKIKGAIKTQVGSSLRCSIGIAPNRYLAKIAADMKKPDGFTAIRPSDLPAILYSLKLRDLPGIGARMEARLRSRGILTLEKLHSLSAKELRQAWRPLPPTRS